MKIKISFLLIQVLICNLAISQDWLEDTCTLKAPVQSVNFESKTFKSKKIDYWEEYTSEFNQNGFLVSNERSSSRAGKKSYGTYRTYDETEKLCLIDYNIQDSDTSSRLEFFYNDKGQMDSSHRYNWGKKYNTVSYSYDDQGNKTDYLCVIRSGESYPESFKYDDKNRLIYHEDISEKVTQLHYWEYNELGYLIKETYLDSNRATRRTHYMNSRGSADSTKLEDFSSNANTEKSFIALFEYNDQGQVIKETRTKIDGTLIHTISYTYNKNGDIKTSVFSYGESGKVYNHKMSYKYDSYGNWIKKETISSDNSITNESRKIKYFKV